MINTMLTSSYQRRLVKKWNAILKEGTPIKNEHTKVVMAQLLENTVRDFAKKGLIREAYDQEFSGDGAIPSTQGRVLGKAPANGGYLTGKNGYFNQDNYGDFMIPNMVMPILRRVFPDLIAHELVGVQALNGPVGFAMALRAKYNYNGIVGDGGLANYREIGGWAPPDTRYSGWDNQAVKEFAGYKPEYDLTATTHPGYTSNKIPHPGASEELSSGSATLPRFDKHPLEGEDVSTIPDLSGNVNFDDIPFNNPLSGNITKQEMWEAYAGTGDYRGHYQGFGADVIPQTEYASLQDGTYPTVGLDFIKQTVEAKVRKLGASWSPELAEDVQAMHGIDVESEMVNIISYEIGGEIDRQILTAMVRAAITGGSVSIWNPAFADGLDQMGRLATLLTKITVEAQQISFRTRRGNANFVVTSPRVTGLLQQMSMNKFVSFANDGKVPTVPQSGVGSLQKQGYINDGAQLLVRDAYSQSDYVLLGYKGTHPGDSGIIYCPYIPIQISKTVRDDTFTPQIGCRTRYGIMDSPWDARLYYHFIKIDGLGSTYTWNGDRKFFG